MSNITFDDKAQTDKKKEDVEWLRIWCEEVNDSRLPHVALIGDSITEGYYGAVKKALEGVARVDYLATSYSVASEIYAAVVQKFVEDSDYAAVHFNYGLHAFGVDGETYEKRLRAILQKIKQKTKTAVATTTTVLCKNLQDENPDWQGKVTERNARISALAKDMGMPIDDLNAVCKTFCKAERNKDGVHFNESGYALLAQSVAAKIKELIEA